MSHHIGRRFQWMANPVHSNEILPITPEREIELNEAVNSLSKILGDKERWVVTGGLSIALYMALYGESFYRNHLDIDIGVHEVDLRHIVDSSKQLGYDLGSRIVMGKVLPKTKIDVYEQVDVETAIKERKKNLRLVRLEKNGDFTKHLSILDYIDVYVHRIQGSDMIPYEGGIIAPAVYNFGEVYYAKGSQIRLRSLQYLEILKKSLDRKVDKLDLQMIRKLFEKTNSRI
jgi:hypothetical protein